MMCKNIASTHSAVLHHLPDMPQSSSSGQWETLHAAFSRPSMIGLTGFEIQIDVGRDPGWVVCGGM